MVERQIEAVQGVLPPEAVKLIATWLQALIQGPTRRGSAIGLMVSVLLAVGSMWSATGMLRTAVNICYGEEQRRGFLSLDLHTWRLAPSSAFRQRRICSDSGAARRSRPAAGIRRMGSHARSPPLADSGGDHHRRARHRYRYAPDRAEAKRRWISWGSIAATALWIFGSIAFATYVSKVGSYDRTYGAWRGNRPVALVDLTAYIILAGAGLNAEIESRITRAKQILQAAVGRSTIAGIAARRGRKTGSKLIYSRKSAAVR